MTLVDGGLFTNLDLGEAVIRCREEVEKDEDIIVDIILLMNKPINIKEWTMKEAKWKNAYQINQRTKELKNYYYYYDDVYRVIQGYPNVNFRYLFYP